MLLPTNDEACLISLTSGIFFLLTGVGTVTINISQSLSFNLSLVKKTLF